VPLSNLTNGFRHGGRKQGCLPLSRGLRQHPFHVFGETHPQHLVGFIQYQCLQPLERQRTAAHVIHNAARRTHHHVYTAIQLAELHLVILPAINRRHAQTLHARRVAFKRLCHLNGKLAGRSQHQNLCLSLTRV
jgi:hypothetical protein